MVKHSDRAVTLEKLSDKIVKKESTICVVGLGYVGLCVAAVYADTGFKVIGGDVNEEVVRSVNEGKTPFYEPGLDDLLSKVVKEGYLRATTDVADAVRKSDVVIITVGTPMRESKIDLSYLESASREIGKNLRRGTMVIVKSTVLPGMTESVVKPILEEESKMKAGIDFALVYSPERLAEGRALKELRALPEIIGGLNEVSAKLAEVFIKSLGVEIVRVSSPRAAEMAKLADNLWIDQAIAIANQLALICEKLGIDVSEVINAANTLPRGKSFVNILRPGLVGGSCLTKDPYFLARLAEEKGIDASLILAVRRLNEAMYPYVVDLVKESMSEIGREVKGSKIAVLGLAFKGETGDTRESQAIQIVRELQRLGADVYVHDPYVDKVPEGINMVKLDECVKDADCIVVATEHSRFKEIDLERVKNLAKKPCAIVDAREIFDPREAMKLGFVWRGLGRPREAFTSQTDCYIAV